MRRKITIASLLLGGFLLTACGETDDTGDTPSAAAPSAWAADMLYTNGVIWTGLNAADARVMAVKDGIITYVGSGETVRIAARQMIDLDGRFVMPGFIDNHVHFFEGGFALASVDLRDAATPEEFTKRIEEYSASLPAGRWVLNGNWDHERWGGTLPHRDWIDAATPQTPVFVIRLDGHMALANSVALRLAGIDATTPAPEGGEIVRDVSGELTGVLKGAAMNAVLAVIPRPSDDEQLQAFEQAQAHALQLGLTQVHAVTAGHTETGMLDAFRLARERGLIKLRVHVYTPLEHWRDTADLVAHQGTGDDILGWGGIKGFVDGSLGSSTAWFYEPFADDPDNNGLPMTDPATLKSLIAEADNAGLRLAIHAIGDNAIDLLIGSMSEIAGADTADRRYRIEHFQHPTREAIDRAAANGIIVAMQPYHAIDDGRWAEKRIGAERIKTTYAFRSILDAGGLLTFGSDWPVAPLSPLEGIYAAVTRRTLDGADPGGWVPEQKISVQEALTAYTATNAYAVFEEDRAGTLEAGKRADFIVLSDDPRAVDADAIRDIAVLRTVIGGKSEYIAR